MPCTPVYLRVKPHHSLVKPTLQRRLPANSSPGYGPIASGLVSCPCWLRRPVFLLSQQLHLSHLQAPWHMELLLLACRRVSIRSWVPSLC